MSAWQSSVARSHLSKIIDQAVAGTPQFIQRRDGKEVVVVSREYYDRTKANLKSFLLTECVSGPGEDAFDAIMRDIRADTGRAYGVQRRATET